MVIFEYADGVNDSILDNVDIRIHDRYVLCVGNLCIWFNIWTLLLQLSVGKDFEPLVDEYRIVGDLRADPISITSIKAGDGVFLPQLSQSPHVVLRTL